MGVLTTQAKQLENLCVDLLGIAGGVDFQTKALPVLRDVIGSEMCSVFVSDDRTGLIVDGENTVIPTLNLDDLHNHYAHLNPILPAVKPLADQGHCVR